MKPRNEQTVIPVRARKALAASCACFLSVALALGGWGTDSFSLSEAHADETTDAQQAVDQAATTLDGAEARLTELVASYDELAAASEELQRQIDEVTAQALVVQEAVIKGRTALGKTAVYEYRSGTAASLVSLLLESSDFNELMRNLSYLGEIAQYQADEIEAQKQRSERFDALMKDLNARKDEQDAKLAEMEAKRTEAQQVVSNAEAQLQNAQSDQTSRLAALRAMEQQMAASQSSSDAVIADDWNTNSHPADVDNNQSVQPDPEPVVPDSGTGSGSGSGSGSESGSTDQPSEVAWMTGVASAYGGSTDPYTPNPGITATGAVCNDYSMGVAVPMAWPNYRSYFGRTVEISYGGMTVLATVNDCGYMGAGARSLDLQPGVWKAFGYSSCIGWGLRTVSYRFL